MLAGCSGAEAPALRIVTVALPQASSNMPYQAQITAVGGSQSEYTWSVVVGSLPPGLTLSPAGTPEAQITGTPRASGTFTFTLGVVDLLGERAEQRFTLEIQGGTALLAIDGPELIDASLYAPYKQSIFALGGTGRGYRWSVSGGSLPPGMTLASEGTPATILAGTASVAGDFSFSVRVEDSEGVFAQADATLTVRPQIGPLRIEAQTLVEGVTEAPYAAVISALGGEGSYQWSVSEGALPPGLSLQSGTPSALLSGRPQAAGSFNFSLEVSDGSSVASQAFTVVVVAPLSLVTESLPAAFVGQPYSATISAMGGAASEYRWSVVQGSLPAGFTLPTNGAPGVTLSGQGLTAGRFRFTIEVVDAGGRSVTRALTLLVADGLTISTEVLPEAVLDQSYSGSIVSVGGTGAHTFSVVSGALPPGLSLSASTSPMVQLSGIPSASGIFSFALQVQDESGAQAVQGFSVRVVETLQIETLALPDTALGGVYLAELVARGGLGGGYRWSVVQGSLPPGLSLLSAGTPATQIFGVSQALGSFGFTVEVDDGAGQTAAASFTIEVSDLSIDTANIGSGALGQPYSQMLSASGGAGGYTWSISQGRLPAGLSLNGDGQTATLSGVPQEGGPFQFSVRVVDANGSPAERSYTLQIDTPLNILTRALPSGRRGDFYSANLSAQGGAGTGAMWSVASGALPPGMALSSGPSATISGTPTVPGAFSFELQIIDASGSASAFYTLVVQGDARWLMIAGDLTADSDTYLYAVDVGAGGTTPVRVNGLAPGTGDLSFATDAVAFSPDNRKVAYIGDFGTDNVSELYVVDLSGASPSIARRVNATLGTASDVNDFRWSPDSRKIAYHADPTASNINELFVVDVSGVVPGTARRVNGALVTNGDVQTDDFFWSPDSSKIAYVADQTVDNVLNLYVVDVSGTIPGPSQQVNGPLNPAADVDDFILWTPDSRGLIYSADQDEVGVEELYFVDVSGASPAPSVKINEPMVTGGDVQINEFGLSPDGSMLFYIADQEVDEVDELYLVRMNGLVIGAPLKLNPPLTAAQDVEIARWSPDSTRLLYTGDQETDGAVELYVVDVASGSIGKVNGALGVGGGVVSSLTTGFAWSGDGTRVAYRADQDFDGVFELFVADVTQPQPWVARRVNLQLPANADVDRFQFAPDSRSILFRGDPNLLNQTELYWSDLTQTSPGTPVRISGTMVAGGDVSTSELGVAFREDGQQIFFVADRGTDAVTELWRTNSGPSPGTPVRLSGVMVTGGDVSRFYVQR